MAKLAYITSDNFIDVDLPIIPHLNNKYDLTWFVIFAKKKVVDYDAQYIERFAESNKINCKILQLAIRFSNIKIIKKWKILIDDINKIRADVIYIDLFGIPYFLFMAHYLLNQKKIIYAAHEIITHESVKGKEKWARYIYLKFIFKKIQNIQVFSKNMESILNKYYPGKKYFCAPLALKNYGPIAQPMIDDGYIHFLFFGNIRRNKRLELLIKTADKLSQKTKIKFKITIAGNCQNWEEYSKIMKEHSIYKVIIRVIKNDEIAELFSEAHYLVLPYRIVSQSGPLMIAYNYNIPVIASDIPGFREYIIHKETGYLFDSQDESSLEKVMLKVIENHKFDYMKIKENLKKYTENELSTESIIEKYDSFINKLLMD